MFVLVLAAVPVNLWEEKRSEHQHRKTLTLTLTLQQKHHKLS